MLRNTKFLGDNLGVFLSKVVLGLMKLSIEPIHVSRSRSAGATSDDRADSAHHDVCSNVANSFIEAGTTGAHRSLHAITDVLAETRN